MQAKANGEGERNREQRGEKERVMGTERLCKTKEREEDEEEEDSSVGLKHPGWQQARDGEAGMR